MKSRFASLLLLAVLSWQNPAWAGQGSMKPYTCDIAPGVPGKNIGMIKVVGDPVANKYKFITIDGQGVRFQVEDPPYIWLFNSESGENAGTLEVFNMDKSYEEFYLFVYPPHMGAMRSFRLATYICKLSESSLR